jgi:IS30 family transposase
VAPEQIVGHLRLTHADNPLMEISHESIYRAIYTTRWKVIPRERCSWLRTGISGEACHQGEPSRLSGDLRHRVGVSVGQDRV